MKKEDNGYEAIGKFVVEFSKLTYTVGLCIKKLVEKDNSLLEIINSDKRLMKIRKDEGYEINKNTLGDLRYILTTGELVKIFKNILINKYEKDFSFLKVLDMLFVQIDKFCSYDGLRNDLMHGGLLIDEKNLGNIMFERKVLNNGELIDKKYSMDLDKVNEELGRISVNIYAFSKILHYDSKIENYIIIQNGELKFLETAGVYIKKKIKI